jgi:restriction system protein
MTETAERNEQLDERVADLAGILTATFDVDSRLDLETLKTVVDPPQFDPEALAASFPLAPPPKGLRRLVPGAMKRHRELVERHKEVVDTMLAQARAEHQESVRQLEKEASDHNAEIDRFRISLEAGEPDAIVQYFHMVLERSPYPDGFPNRSKAAYVPESKQLVIEYDLPPLSVVPTEGAFRYVKVKDEILSTPRPARQRTALYASIVAQVALRVIHEVFWADRRGMLDVVVFNGHVDTVDRATGKPARPCLVTVRTTRETFLALDLSNVEPAACLRGLNASVSKSPAELVPVRPVLEFNMVDPRFIEETDVLTTLDKRPNLMELTPSEFENLITNLFERMGLETRLTQASRDGGVDCVAYDPRPIFGGKVVIQAKRYKNTVGVSAVRDLFGTLQNEGASKGILVTTSGYGKAAFEFAEGKPLELLSGSNLLYLLAKHAGVEAKIEPPDDWQDPFLER